MSKCQNWLFQYLLNLLVSLNPLANYLGPVGKNRSSLRQLLTAATRRWMPISADFNSNAKDNQNGIKMHGLGRRSFWKALRRRQFYIKWGLRIGLKSIIMRAKVERTVMKLREMHRNEIVCVSMTHSPFIFKSCDILSTQMSSWVLPAT